MFRDLFNFQGINWWTLLGGMGLNFIISMVSSLVGSYLAATESTTEMYQRFGAPAMVLAIFLLCGLSGYIIAKIADDVPVKHAFLSSLGSFVPFVFAGVMSFNPMPLMLAVVAAAGNLNGGVLGAPRPRSRSSRD